MSRVSTQVQAGAVDQSPELEDLKKRSQFWDIWRRLRRNKLAMLGLIIVLILVLSAVFANFIAPYDYAQQDLTNMKAWPSREHLLGTDDYGRDILSRIIYGGRVSLLVAILSIVFGLVVGGILGISAGLAASMMAPSCESWTSSWQFPAFCWQYAFPQRWAPAY